MPSILENLAAGSRRIVEQIFRQRTEIYRVKYSKPSNIVQTCWLVDLLFYDPVNQLRSCRARSVNLSTLFLGRFPKQLL